MKTLRMKALLATAAVAVLLGLSPGAAKAFWGHRQVVTTNYAMPSVPVAVGYAPVVASYAPVVTASPIISAPVVTSYAPAVAAYAAPVTSYYAPAVVPASTTIITRRPLLFP